MLAQAWLPCGHVRLGLEDTSRVPAAFSPRRMTPERHPALPDGK
jgi:hypothetical protein